jgi:hypothetical protein
MRDAWTSSAGNVTNPAITLTFTLNESTASGSANAGSTTEIANSLSGDNATTEHVVGPGIAGGSLGDAGATATNLAATGVGVNNTRERLVLSKATRSSSAAKGTAPPPAVFAVYGLSLGYGDAGGRLKLTGSLQDQPAMGAVRRGRWARPGN